MTYTVHKSIASHAYGSNKQWKLVNIYCKATKTYFSSNDMGMNIQRRTILCCGTFSIAKTSRFVRKQPILCEIRGNYIDNGIDDLNIPF